MRENSKSEIDNELIHFIATSQFPISRTDLAKRTGLSKMTVSKHISELIRSGLIVESDSIVSAHSMGRNPVSLSLSNTSPCICGMRIKKGCITTIFADISGKIIDMVKHYFNKMENQEELTAILLSQYDELASRTKRRILGCGISSIGPIDHRKGRLLTPANFYGISNYPIVSIIHEHTGLPTYLIHDAKAGALVEKLYGRGHLCDNYIYLFISEGIGMGLVMNGQLFYGFSGQNGEIGHVSINFSGPKCSCGNNGCLEQYASVEKMQKKIAKLLPLFPKSVFHKMMQPSWEEIIRQAAVDDPIAITVLDEFCSYLGYAIDNLLKILEIPTVIVGCDSMAASDIVAKMLREKIKDSGSFIRSDMNILSSQFEDASLLGAIAVVADEVFKQNIAL